MKRRVEPELLDTLPPGDPAAMRSRQDLRRVNAWMRNPQIMARALRENAVGPAPHSILELGAGDGDFLLAVARQLSPAWTGTRAVLLDRQLRLSPATGEGFRAVNWPVAVSTEDVFDWEPPAAHHSVIIANLFLHHFAEAKLAELLQKIAGATRLFIAVEPRRMPWPAFGGLLLALIGCNHVTRHDGTVSIRAGFAGREISGLWPHHDRWQITERRSGCFSHLFIARKCDGVDRT
jgi:hypothetical protein